jgi:hypothetical protein
MDVLKSLLSKRPPASGAWTKNHDLVNTEKKIFMEEKDKLEREKQEKLKNKL